MAMWMEATPPSSTASAAVLASLATLRMLARASCQWAGRGDSPNESMSRLAPSSIPCTCLRARLSWPEVISLFLSLSLSPSPSPGHRGRLGPPGFKPTRMTCYAGPGG